MIMGIDPGAHTGIATYQKGELVALQTIEPHQIGAYLLEAKPSRVIFEDSRLISFMFTQVKSRAAALKMARNVGEIDGWCRVITAVCGELGIACHGISPKAKGAKVGAAEFARVTGWLASSNEHTRDAAMVAFPYRRAV